MSQALVIGGGPAGLMSADELSRAGAHVTVIEAKPSIGRKFLMAGKSGLNLTKDEPLEAFCAHYGAAESWLTPMLSEFGPTEVQKFARSLGQPVFTGSSGRVFPEAMKASPLLRAWIARLTSRGVVFRTRWRWIGWNGDQLLFDTPEGMQTVRADACVLACGGASWWKLGSDGAWAEWVPSVPFKPSNVGLSVDWSEHMTKHFGAPIKAVRWLAGETVSRGEAVLSENGLEGSGIYSVSMAVRDGAELSVDLTPDLSPDDIAQRFARKRSKDTFSKWAKGALRLSPVKLALLRESVPSETLQTAEALADALKALPIPVVGTFPVDSAISTAGGVPRNALDEKFMLKNRPGTFCAGEMLDWEAPTGGYLLTACFASGRTAGRNAARYLGLTPAL